MLIVAWQRVQQIAMPIDRPLQAEQAERRGPARQADEHHRRAVVRGHPAVGEIARERVEDQRRDSAETGHEPEVDGLVSGAGGRLDQPRQHVLDRGEQRDRGAEVRQHQHGDEGRPGSPGDRRRKGGRRSVGVLHRRPGVAVHHRARPGGYRPGGSGGREPPHARWPLPGNNSRHQSLVHVASGPEEHATTRASQALPRRRAANPGPAFRNLSDCIASSGRGRTVGQLARKGEFGLIDLLK